MKNFTFAVIFIHVNIGGFQTHSRDFFSWKIDPIYCFVHDVITIFIGRVGKD